MELILIIKNVSEQLRAGGWTFSLLLQAFPERYNWSQFNDVKRTELRAQKGTISDMEPQMPSMTTHLGTWQIACGEWSHWPQQKLGHLESDPHDNSKANPWGRQTNEFELRYQQTFSDLTSWPTSPQGEHIRALNRKCMNSSGTGVNWDSWRFQWDAVHRKHRQGDAGIGESDHNLDGHFYLNDHPGALDPGERRLKHFCETLWKQYSSQEPKWASFNRWSLMGMTSARAALLGLASSAHSNYSFHYYCSYFIQACVSFPFVIATENLQFNKTPYVLWLV